MRRDEPVTRMTLAIPLGAMVLLAISASVFGVPAYAQGLPACSENTLPCMEVVDLLPTAQGQTLGVQAGTATIEVMNANKTKVSFSLSGIPAISCSALSNGQALLSGWLRFIDAEGNLDLATAAANLVEPWGPPPTIKPDAPEGCIAAYPIPLTKAGGAVTSGCYDPVPNVISWSPIAKSTALYFAGMGGAIDPDPNGFVSDSKGSVNVMLKTDFDFTEGRPSTLLVLNPRFFGSSVPPFFAQCTTLDASPAPPVCAGSGGVLKSVDSGFKRVYETKPVIVHSGPPAATFGPGIIHDFDGPCDNQILTPGPPCGRDDFTIDSPHPLGTDGGVGLRHIKATPEGRQTLARGAATAISVVLHHDCVTHGHIPGNPEFTNGDRTFPAEFVEILRGFLP